MSEWIKFNLGELITIKHGYAFSGKYITSVKNNNILVTPGNFKIGGGFKADKFKYFSSDDYPKEYLFDGGELIVTMTDLSKETDTLGFVALVPKDTNKYLHNQRVGLINILDESVVDKLYLYWKLRTNEYQSFIANSASGTSVMHTSPKKIYEYSFLLPSLIEQTAIASVLSSLDNKIDLLHCQNKTLEAMAETLFRQWFADDSNGSGKEVELHEIIEFNPKRVLPKGSKAMYLEMAGLNTNTFAASGYYERDFTSGQKFIKQDTLLARITPCLENGKAGYVHFLSPEQVGWGSTEFIVLRPKPKFHPLFSYILCRNNEFKEYAESCMEGSSGRQRVNVSHLSMYTLTLPHDDVITQFNEILASIEPKLISNALQIQTLENLRDTLLPKLMSGEVRVNYTPKEIKQ
ncbi:TPA: restriction endonuclease subunit S [Morganella morganii]|nr:restriction endonuclease subunit S [Morganella morganii]